MEALEKPKEKRMKSGGPHGTKSKPATVDPAATHQHVRLRIKLPVSPARNLAGLTKGAKSTTGASVTTNHEPAVSDLSDHKSSDTEPNSPVPEYQDFSNTSLKELRRRYEAKFGTATLSNNSDYLKRKLAGQCGPPRLRRTNADHDVAVDRSPKRSPRRSPTFRRRKVEDVLEPDSRGVETEEELDLELEEADGEDEDSDPDCGMQDGDASTPLKKQRSGRKDGGANQWTNQAEEIRRIVRKKRRNRAFPPQTLVWAKLEGRPWWPARVVMLEDVPESVQEKKLVGWTCVELYGLPATDELRFAWLKRENLASYKKFRKDFNEQKFPERFEDMTFQLALKEISEEAKRRRTADTPAGTKLFREDRDSSMELLSSNTSSSEEDVSEPPLLLGNETIDTSKKHLRHRAEIVQGKLKQLRMKKAHSLRAEDLKPARPMWPIKGDEDQTPPKLKKTKDNGGDMNRKRKRHAMDEHQKDDSQGTSDEAEDVAMPDSPQKKAVSDSKFNRQSFGKKLSRSLSNAGDSVKVDKDGSRKPKRTGEDGYYYDCEVCGIGGELLCCDLCPRVYHLECLTPPLKRTPPGKWVCPTCRDRSGVMRSAGSSLADARQQAKVKGVEDPLARSGQKIWRKEKPTVPPVMSSDKHSKRKREDSDSKTRRKRAKSKGEEDGQRRLNCGYCGVETSSLRSSGLCDKCHSEIRAGTVDDHPSNSAPAECVETAQHEKDKQKSGRCHTCGERGVVVSCENCSFAFHKDCVVPPLRKTPNSPWFCSNCSAGVDYKLGDEQPSDALSAEVQRILGCRIVGGPGSPLSGRVTEMEKDRQLKIDTSEVEERNVNGSATDVLEGPGDAADIEWKVVKRKQASDVNPTRGAQAAVPMEIDSLSGAGAGAGASVVDMQPTSPDSGEGEPETKIVVSESESTPEKTCARIITKERLATKLSSNGAIQVVEDPSFVIEIGGHDMNLNVRLPLDGVAKTDGNVTNEIARGRLPNSVLQQDEGVTTKIKEIENGRDPAADVIVVEAPEKKGNTEPLREPNTIGTAGQGDPSPSLEFLVKWRGRSHIHNEWVSEERLQAIAKRKLEKYKAKYGTAPLIVMDDQYLKPQRVLARRVGKSGSAEVLVKWHGQAYNECTWEEERHPVIAQNLELVQVSERFEEAGVARKANMMTSDSRPSGIEELAEQPEWLRGGGVLFPHQLEALNWLRKSWYRRRNVILADEMGLGKTITTCAFLSSLYREFYVNAPCLVLVPLSTMPKWVAEFSVWAPFLNVIEYYGSTKARAVIREYEWYATAVGNPGDEGRHPDPQAIKFNVMLTSYETVIADSSQLRSVPWEVLIVDEGHRLKNSESKLFPLLNTFKSGLRVLLTGTALQNNLSEMCNLLNFLQPETFPSQGAFEEKFGSLGIAEQVDELKKLVAPHMLRRLKKDAMQNIPFKAERVVPVELTPVQAEHYRAVLTKNYQLLREGSGGKPGGQNQSLLSVVMQLRKVCNHPYLLPGSEPEGRSLKLLHEMRIKASAKLTLLHSMLHHLKKGGHRVLIFSQMTKLLDILEDYLSFEFGDQSFERVDESVPVAERQGAISRFNQDQSRFVFLLSTRSCGLGINLATVDTVIIHDSDFNPHADIQAMNRAHQIGQSKSLLVYRLVVRASVEERILQLARKTSMAEYLFANKSGSPKDVKDIIRWGTEELFAEDRSKEAPALLSAENGAAAEELRMKQVDEKRENPSRLDLKHKDKSEEGTVVQDKSQKKVKAGKVVWDDAAISRLLDRSELATTNLEVAEGDQEGDWSGSLKTWTWNEPGRPERVGSEEGAARDIGAVENPLKSTVEEQNKWEELLRPRWEKLQREEEAAQGREKRARINVLDDGFLVLKSVEDSSDRSEEELDGDRSSDPTPKHAPRVKQLLGKVRAGDQDSNLGDGTQLSLAHEEKPGSGSFKTPASTSSNPLAASLSQVATHDGHTEERRPKLEGVNSNGSAKSSATQIPITIDLEDAPRTTPSINIINVEQSRNGNVSYPHRVYTVPGTPVGLAGEQLLASSKHLVSSPLLSREQIDPDLSILRKQLDRGSQSSLSSQAMRQLLSPAIQGSSGQYGSVGHSNIRPLPFDGVSGSRVPHAGSEERVFGNLGNKRHDPELQGLQPDLLQRAYARETQNSAMLSTSGLSDVPLPSSKKDARDATGSMSMSEILRRVANKQGGIMLPPASTDGKSPSQFLANDLLPSVLGTSLSSQGSPNLSMSLGLGGLNLTSQDQAFLVRALASHDSQNLARSYNKTGTSLGGPSSSGGSGDATRVQVGETLLASGAGDHHEGKPSDGASRLLSSSQDMVGLQSVPKHEMGKKSPPFGESDARFKQGSQVEPWSEDELDSLWTGVRRMGCGSWGSMLLDRRLVFHKSRTALDLQERWKEEQAKLFGAPRAETESKPARQGYSPLSSGDDAIGQRHRDHNSAGEEGTTVKKSKESAEAFFPKDTIDLSGTSTIISQGLGATFGEFDRKQVLESLRAVDLSYRRSAGLTGNPAIDRVEYSKVPEPSSALDLVNSVRSQVSTIREGGSASRSGLAMEPGHTVEFDKWEGTTSRRRTGAAKDMLLQAQLQKTKLPASFLANLSFNQDAREKQSREELRDQHTLPLLPQTVSAPGLGLLGQSSSGAFPHHKASFGQQENFLPRGFHDSPRGHHDSRASSLSSTFAELDKRRLKMGLGSSKNLDGMGSSEANQSLPHWLREAFKPDQPPPPKPATVSPMITAVAQATSFLYKDCVPFLPTFVHPGPLPAPPRRAAKKRRRPAAAGDAESHGRGAEAGRNELNFVMSGVESTNPSLSSSLQQFASSLNAGFNTGSVPPASVPSFTSSFSKRLVDFSALPSLDPPAQPSFSRPSPALEELMSLRNLSSLPPLAPPLNDSDQSLTGAAQALDPAPNLVSSAKGDRHGAKDGTRHLEYSNPFPATKLSPVLHSGSKEATHSRRRKEATDRSKHKPNAFPYKLPSHDSGSPTDSLDRRHRQDGSGESKLPSWMIAAADVGARSRQQQASSKASSKHEEDGNSSSETESDPRIRGAAGMTGEDDSDASSDETVSDDRTQ